MFVKIQVLNSKHGVVRESLYKYSGQEFDDKIFALVEESNDELRRQRKEWLAQNEATEDAVEVDELGNEYVFGGGYSDFVDGEQVVQADYKLYIPEELQTQNV